MSEASQVGMVPTYDVRSTGSRYSSCSTSNTTIHAFRPENNVGVSSQPVNDTRVLCLKQTKVTLLPKKSTMKMVYFRAMAKNRSSRCFLAKNGFTLKTMAAESVVGRI